MFQYYISPDCMWFRLFDHGLNLKRTPMLFSERSGITKSIKLPFGWRLTKLKPYRR